MDAKISVVATDYQINLLSIRLCNKDLQQNAIGEKEW